MESCTLDLLVGKTSRLQLALHCQWTASLTMRQTLPTQTVTVTAAENVIGFLTTTTAGVDVTGFSTTVTAGVNVKGFSTTGTGTTGVDLLGLLKLTPIAFSS